MLVLNLPFKALMFLTLMRPSLVLFLVLWLKLVKDFLKVRCRLALLPFLISCLIWLDLVASLPLIKERILVIILLLHFLSLMIGSVLVLMLPLLVWLTPDLRLKKRLLAFSRRLHARIPKTTYMHKMRCLRINRRSLLLALRLLWKTPIFPSFFFFNDTATTEIYTLSLHDALPICSRHSPSRISHCRRWHHNCAPGWTRSEEHTSELQSHHDLVCRLLLEKKKKKKQKLILKKKKKKTK